MKQLFTILYITFCALTLSAQGIYFSDNREIPMQLNPAFAGVMHNDYVHRLNLAHRRQGNTVLGKSEFETSYASYDHKLGLCSLKDGMFMGVGLEVLHDQVGFNFGENTQYFHRQQANLNTSLGIKLSKGNYLIAGLRTGLLSRGLSGGNLTFDNQFDGRDLDSSLPTMEAFGNERLFFFDIGAGFMLRGSVNYVSVRPVIQLQNYEVGISFMHLNNKKKKFLLNSNEEEIDTEFRVHTKLQLRIARAFNLNPSLILYKYRHLLSQGKQWQVVPSLEFPLLKNWMLASGMRISNFAEGGSNLDALIFSLKWKPFSNSRLNTRDNTIVGLSLDLNISPHLARASNGFGAFEFFVVKYFTGNNDKVCCPWRNAKNHQHFY